MAYVPDGDSYWKWYAGYTRSPSWHLETVIGAEANALRQLIKHGMGDLHHLETTRNDSMGVNLLFGQRQKRYSTS